MPLTVTYQNGSIFEGPLAVVEDLDMMTFQCLTETETPCDALPNSHTVRVFGEGGREGGRELQLLEMSSCPYLGLGLKP